MFFLLILLVSSYSWAENHAPPAPLFRNAPVPAPEAARSLRIAYRHCELADGKWQLAQQTTEPFCYCNGRILITNVEACINNQIVSDPGLVERFRDSRRYSTRVPTRATAQEIDNSIRFFKSVNHHCPDFPNYPCQHYTKLFCEEWKRIGGDYCVGFNYGYRNGFLERLNSKHRMAMVHISSTPEMWALIEPQGGKVIQIWRFNGYPERSDLDTPPTVTEALQKLDNRTDTLVSWLFDAEWTFGSGLDCCRCVYPRGGTEVIDASTLLAPNEQLFCNGACLTRGANFLERVSCSETRGFVPPTPVTPPGFTGSKVPPMPEDPRGLDRNR